MSKETDPADMAERLAVKRGITQAQADTLVWLAWTGWNKGSFSSRRPHDPTQLTD